MTKETFALETKTIIENSNNVDLKTYLAGVYPANKISYFANFHSLRREKGSKYPFIISNTDK